MEKNLHTAGGAGGTDWNKTKTADDGKSRLQIDCSPEKGRKWLSSQTSKTGGKRRRGSSARFIDTPILFLPLPPFCPTVANGAWNYQKKMWKDTEKREKILFKTDTKLHFSPVHTQSQSLPIICCCCRRAKQNQKCCSWCSAVQCLQKVRLQIFKFNWIKSNLQIKSKLQW